MLIKKISISILFCSLISSCSFADLKKKFSKNDETQNQESQIRIVDVNGNYRPIKRQIPIYNSQLMYEQQNQNTQPQNQNYNSYNTNDQLVVGKIEDDYESNFGPATEPLIESNKLTQNLEEEVVEYNLNEDEKEEIQQAQKEMDEPINKIYKTSKNKSLKGLFVQVGSYISKKGANETLAKGQKFSNGLIKEIKTGNKILHKILLGPVKDKNEARILLKKARSNGFKDAFITKIK